MGSLPFIEVHQEYAVKLVDSEIRKRAGTRALSKFELTSFYPNSVAGWKTKIDVEGSPHFVNLILNRHFPYSKPDVYLESSSTLRGKPHVNLGGSLCLVSGHVSFAHKRPVDIVNFLLKRAEECLALPESEARQELENEFQSYWDQSCLISSRQAHSLVTPKKPSRYIYFFNGVTALLFGEDQVQVTNWIKHLTGKDHQNLLRTALLWLDKPLIPSEFPSTNKDVAEIVKRSGKKNFQLLLNVLPREQSSIAILLGFETENGPSLSAITLQEPIDKMMDGNKIRTRSSVMNGFRPKKIPNSVLGSRYLKDVACQKSITRRVDAEWMYMRGGHSQKVQSVMNKHIVLIGCGSLGGALALGLAKSGITNLTLIDGDRLSVDNVARHVLGIKDVGPPKECGLKDEILSHLPHMNIKVFPGRIWQDINEQQILKSDLVISTTGSWSCDDPLNSLIKAKLNSPPVIFGWLEPFGCAGHALCVKDDGGCLSCGTNESGNFLEACTKWKEETMVRAGACGEFFQPYTILEAMQTQSMIMRMALDTLQGRVSQSNLRTWIGDTSYLHECGGEWNEFYSKELEERPNGGFYTERDWEANSNCLLCNG